LGIGVAISRIKDKGLAELFQTGRSKRIGPQFRQGCLDILDHLNAAASRKDCAGVRDFHKLSGDRAGQYAMHVNGKFVITFRWDETGGIEVLWFGDCHGK
jgi:proteic killer suppression protein